MNNEFQKGLISVVIPVWNTKETSLRQCLYSIICQDYKNVEIIIIDDCSDKVNYDNLIQSIKNEIKKLGFNIEIKYFRNEKNSGPGYSRKIGLEKISGEYVTFVDSDDELFSKESFTVLIKKFDENKKLKLVSGLAREQLRDGSCVDHARNFIWVFGKLIKSEFLRENNITFNDSYSNEDNAFNTLCRMVMEDDECLFVEDIVYFWKYEKESITRRDNHAYYFWSIEFYLENMIWVYNECVKRNIQHKECVINQMIAVYIRCYFYAIEIMYIKNQKEITDLFKWIRNFYNCVFSKIETDELFSFKRLNDIYLNMAKSSVKTFTQNIINISFPEFLEFVKSNKEFDKIQRVIK